MQNIDENAPNASLDVVLGDSSVENQITAEGVTANASGCLGTAGCAGTFGSASGTAGTLGSLGTYGSSRSKPDRAGPARWPRAGPPCRPAWRLAMQVPLIHVQEVSLAYGEKLALDKVSLICRPGEMVGLLGPNGAGKTTLLEMLEGVNIPQSGRVAVCGSDPRRFSASHKREVGFIFQRSALPSHVRVGQLVSLVRSSLEAADDAAALLESLGLDALTHQTIGDLSVGQQQRLSAFVALYGRRSTLVMDEPTAALDIRSKRAIWDCVKRKKEREGTGGLIGTT